jgi:hypothetical protein
MTGVLLSLPLSRTPRTLETTPLHTAGRGQGRGRGQENLLRSDNKRILHRDFFPPTLQNPLDGCPGFRPQNSSKCHYPAAIRTTSLNSRQILTLQLPLARSLARSAGRGTGRAHRGILSQCPARPAMRGPGTLPPPRARTPGGSRACKSVFLPCHLPAVTPQPAQARTWGPDPVSPAPGHK